jgi:hypothetical protein
MFEGGMTQAGNGCEHDVSRHSLDERTCLRAAWHKQETGVNTM